METKWTDDEIVYTTHVRVGDIISSPQFSNLIYRDFKDLDPMLGFNVNPRRIKHQSDNTLYTSLESPGMITKGVKGGKHRISIKLELPGLPVFVVVYTERDCTRFKEFDNEDDTEGHYPLIVKACQLGPDNIWDENGIVITFTMQSIEAPYSVEYVKDEGFMNIVYTTIF